MEISLNGDTKANNMYKLIPLIPLMLLLMGCAHSDPWTKRDTALQWTHTLVLAMDAVQTADIHNSPEIEEGGFARYFLGKNPEPAETYTYFAASAVVSYLVTRALPAEWRPWWQGANITRVAYSIVNNCGYAKHVERGVPFCSASKEITVPRDPRLLPIMAFKIGR